ncbi:MAG: hypothetical protein COC01_03985 [Bacteroidetes bacterium]|nr:hypothetical protein [Bacteroidia bacterium]PCH68335.1 MAG: hypothetical protein COC01_03985 [Bacteroidota bacterium]
MKKVLVFFFFIYLTSIVLTNISYAGGKQIWESSVTTIHIQNIANQEYQMTVTAMGYDYAKAEMYESAELETELTPGKEVSLRMYRNLMTKDIKITKENNMVE